VGLRRPPIQLGPGLAPALTCCLSLCASRQACIPTAGIVRAPELSRAMRGGSSRSRHHSTHGALAPTGQIGRVTWGWLLQGEKRCCCSRRPCRPRVHGGSPEHRVGRNTEGTCRKERQSARPMARRGARPSPASRSSASQRTRLGCAKAGSRRRRPHLCAHEIGSQRHCHQLSFISQFLGVSADWARSTLCPSVRPHSRASMAHS